jgi:hypothetical protein
MDQYRAWTLRAHPDATIIYLDDASAAELHDVFPKP